MIPLTDEGDLWKRHFASAEMVIEAVPENLDLKHRYVPATTPSRGLPFVAPRPLLSEDLSLGKSNWCGAVRCGAVRCGGFMMCGFSVKALIDWCWRTQAKKRACCR